VVQGSSRYVEKKLQSVEENQEGKGRKHSIKTKQKMDNIEHGFSGLKL
jgi:hypothetical protein